MAWKYVLSRYLPKATRAALQAQLVCYDCGGPGPFEADHGCPVGLGGGNEPENLFKRCIRCHSVKTKRDVRAIAKAKRIARKLAGTWRKPKGRPIQSRGFRTDIRRKFNGKTEART